MQWSSVVTIRQNSGSLFHVAKFARTCWRDFVMMKVFYFNWLDMKGREKKKLSIGYNIWRNLGLDECCFREQNKRYKVSYYLSRNYCEMDSPYDGRKEGREIEFEFAAFSIIQDLSLVWKRVWARVWAVKIPWKESRISYVRLADLWRPNSRKTK